MEFIGNDFILNNKTAKRLYHEFAEPQPIIDYHCHLDPKEIAENKPFATITDLWLAGDHYKWRAMRANGVPEEKITGNASPEEKFKAWAETVESCVGNPLYHWTHLELKKYFGINEVLNGANWEKVWNQCNEMLKQPQFTPRGLIEQSNVEVICTTDAPCDTLEYHEAISKVADFSTKVLPTFRPDEALDPSAEILVNFVTKLRACTSQKIGDFNSFLRALDERVEYFHQRGGRLSDHGLMKIEYSASTEVEQEALFQKKMSRIALSAEEEVKYTTAVILSLASSYNKRNWTMQVHFGAIRSNNTAMYRKIGANTGYDSIYDQPNIAENLNPLLNAMEENDALPKMILYNLNPGVNDIVASAIGNFQKSGSVKSSIQFGSGWWFSDTKRGMIRQLTTLADQGLLMNFVGMLTDSRSFISYTRHEYFRRILCNLVGQWVADGEIPDDQELLKKLIENISYNNAKAFFKF